MSQPSSTFKTSAIEYMLMPLIRTVKKAKMIAWKARAGSPECGIRYQERSTSC